MRLQRLLAPALAYLALLLSTLPGVASALSLQLTPPDQTLGVGDPVAVDLVVLTPGGVVVGGYDVVVTFDPAVLSLAGVDFGAGLGDPTRSVRDVVPGTSDVEVVQVSLLVSPPQDGTSDVTLFTLLFDALAPGVSALDVSPGSDPTSDFLADAAGFALVPTAVVSGRVVVQAPEPATLLLASSALLALTAVRRATKGGSR